MTTPTNNKPTAHEEDPWDNLLSEEKTGPTKAEAVFERSSLLERASYNKAMQSLTITFRNGARYCYFNVPGEVVDGLFSYSTDKNTGSVGKFFLREIKLKYTHHRVLPEDNAGR